MPARQAAILRQYTEAPLGTDQVPFNTIHYRHMHQPLDLVMFNHYNRTNDLWEAGLWMDYLRNMKDRPFWVTETATCWNGGTVMPGRHQPGRLLLRQYLDDAGTGR